jgi:hypothetical protein
MIYRARFAIVVVALSTVTLVGTVQFRARAAAAENIVPLSQQWSPLAMITGVHSLSNKKLGLELRVLEADGSASVAEDPVSLFLVARKGATSDLTQYIWRLPRGVERVKKVSESKCGVEIQAAVDDGEGPEPRRKNAVIRACFLRPDGDLDPQLRVEDSR